MVDSGSGANFINKTTASKIHIPIEIGSTSITMASTSKTMLTEGVCYIDFTLHDRIYSQQKFHVLPSLCVPLILGRDFMALHKSIRFQLNGPQDSLDICSLQLMDIPPVRLSTNLPQCIKPIAIPSRRYSKPDAEFIQEESRRLLALGIIEESDSSWRAQVLVVNGTHKRRMVIDYSQTVNKFTELDAFPVEFRDM